MNDAHYHILINHLPIMGFIFGTLILLAGIVLRSTVTRKVAFSVLLLAGVSALPTFSSGEDAEEIVEHMNVCEKGCICTPEMMESLEEQKHHLIHEHEEKAEGFMPFAWGLMFLSLISLFVEWKKKKFWVYTSLLTLALSVTAIYFVQEVGATGGAISHPEVRKDFKVPAHEEHEEEEH
ncbi:MAG: hypothetical protein K0R65_1487 [Crocinitomicaceae bacterium]|nr:hypothetical protein [Crocinitomicaceae bacterium]